MAPPIEEPPIESAPALAPSPAPSRPVTPAPARRPLLTHENSQKPQGMNGPLYKQSEHKIVIARRLRRRGMGPWKQMACWLVENQIAFSFNLIALLLLSHASMPKARPHTANYFNLAYYNQETGRYGLGKDDGYFIFFCIILFTGLRAATMEYLLAPFAKAKGVSKRKDLTRFSEQGWLLIYYSVFWTIGLYLYYTSDYWMNLQNLWTNWPDRELSGLMKGYMLGQLAFWMQQIMVINIEERRKDHWQMFTHHVVTICLIYTSYRYHFTKVGNLILVLMDVVDLFLPVAKCLKYLGYKTLCDIAFGVFMLAWFFARHVLYVAVCYSVWAHSHALVPYFCFSGSNADLAGPFDPPASRGWMYMLDPLLSQDGLVCYNNTVKWCFLSALLFLQGITLFWFGMIIKVAIGVFKGQGAEDSRSGDEMEDGEESEVELEEEAAPLEEEVGVEGIDLKGWERRTGVKRAAATASGVSLPGHSDRKELLGRIGCEKQVD
ncbi:longevity assurance proteins LAG1/LAC1 [Coniochaeta ligniaria NRRL 30616]|uniref:Longevity assurance proteins LAG1/LAC1 n=1 Tax=Coniochaeta ligniaria NRRL 30616 TaxID=1408157 RepID=A0A1J7JD85_9PEZI|nr:longevity assurance proteins LAG1/LAC1 [Coniochaeta ligniaria NRRL 30616]